MQRVYFLIKAPREQRLSCLLNPESLVLRRTAGVRPRRSATGLLAGAGLADNPLLYTGGGQTELDLDLLFDVALADRLHPVHDVRDLTGPLWRLAENGARSDGGGAPALVWFFWGKSWHIPGIVVAVAERLERFTQEGIPQRSWLRMRMLRVDEDLARRISTSRALPPSARLDAGGVLPRGGILVHELSGGASPGPGATSPAGMAALSVGKALLTAADIIAVAIAQTPAGGMLASARESARAAAERVGALLGEWAAAAGETAAARAISAGLATITGAVQSAAASGRRAVEAIVGAAGQVERSARAILGRLAALRSPGDRPFVERIRAAVQPIVSVAKAMYLAAHIVAAAVKARSAEVMAAAVRHIRTASASVAAALDSAVTATSAAAARAVSRARAALATIADVLQKLQATGAVAVETLVGALRAAASSGEALWSAGARATAKTINAGVEALSFALKWMLASTEAIASVARARAAPALTAAVAAIRAALEQLRSGEPSARDAIRAELETIAAIAAPSVAPAPPAPAAAAVAPGQIPEALRQIRAALDQHEAAAALAALAPIAGALDLLAAGVEALPAVDEQERARLSAAAAVAADQPAAPPPAIDTQPAAAMAQPGVESRGAGEATGERVNAGERLDQLAFEHYGNPALWRLLATFNGIDHPLRMPTGLLLQIPPPGALRFS